MPSIRSEARLRQDARAIFRAALDAVDPVRLVTAALRSERLDAPPEGSLSVIGFGKAVLGMAAGVDRTLGSRVQGGVLVGPRGSEGADGALPPTYRRMTAGHPDPDADSVAGALAVRDRAAACGSGDVVIVLVSGGGSALLSLPPPDVSVQDVATVISSLSRTGASIQCLNTVRKHLDQLKGGRLARVCAPARVLALVLSDVPGDALDTIASGPLTADRSTFAEALERVRGLGDAAPRSVLQHLIRGASGDIDAPPPPDDPCFRRVRQIVVGSGSVAARAACDAARGLGYSVEAGSTRVVGDVAGVAAGLAGWVRRHADGGPACIVSAGEPTVRLTGRGSGGRNQQLALEASTAIAGAASALVGSLASDGVDGPTAAAGAVVTGSSVARARAAGFDIAAHLGNNDAFPVLAALDDLILTGETGTNVADIQLALVG